MDLCTQYWGSQFCQYWKAWMATGLDLIVVRGQYPALIFREAYIWGWLSSVWQDLESPRRHASWHVCEGLSELTEVRKSTLKQGPELHKKGKVGSPNLCLCFLTREAMGPAASGSYCYEFPAMMDCTPELWTKINLIFPELLFPGHFIIATGTEMETIFQIQWRDFRANISQTSWMDRYL